MSDPNQPPKKVNTNLQRAIESILTDRPIAYHVMLAEAVGSVTAGVFLSQLLYWTPRARDHEGWIFKTRDEIRKETALTRAEQETARKTLRRVGILEEERRGVGALVYYHIDMEKLASLLAKASDDDDPEGDGPEDYPEPPLPTQKAQTQPSGIQKAGNALSRKLESSRLDGAKSAIQNAGIQPSLHITENTTESTTESVVENQLKNFGISEKTATRLSTNYPEEHISDKLAVAQWLVGQDSPLVRKNPAGWLKTAIEEDFDAPKDYETPSTRKARTEKQAKTAAAEAEKRKQAEEEFRQAQETIQRRIRENHPPEPVGKDGLTTESAWALTLEKMETQISPAMFETWLKNTMLVSVEGKNANVVVPNQHTADWIDRRLYQSLNQTFRDIIGREVDFRFVPAEVPPLTPA